jgi:hypothetical protein
VYIVLAIYGVVLIGISVGEMASRYRLVLGGKRDLASGPKEAPP